MIEVPAGFVDMHDSASVAKAVCWRITRKDGQVIRLTDWNAPVQFDGETFVPVDTAGGGAQNSALRRDGAQREHNTGLGGVLSSDLLTLKDLKDGRFRGARVDVIRLDPRYPWIARQEKQMQVTDLRFSEAGWFADLTSASALAMRRKWGEKASSTCRNSLFDANCTRCIGNSTVGLNCSEPSLRKEQYQLGHAPGNYPEVVSVDESTNRIACTVRLPRSEVVDIIPGSTGFAFRTATPHYLSGPSPTGQFSDGVQLPVILRGNVGFDPPLVLGLPQPGKFFGVRPWILMMQCTPTLVPAPNRPGLVSGGSVFGYLQAEPAAGYFDFGTVEWISGDNVGLVEQIRSSGAFQAAPSGSWAGTIELILDAPLPNPIQVGDTVQLTAGCDKRIQTCSSKFITNRPGEGPVNLRPNTTNFRGEPTIRGNQKLVETPTSPAVVL